MHAAPAFSPAFVPVKCCACAQPVQAAQAALFDFPTVVSDCRPWTNGRAVGRCTTCGLMQRLLDPTRAAEYRDVYAHYAMYSHARDGSDQQNFDADGMMSRTEKILRVVTPQLAAQPQAVLDIGCGSGAGLVSLARAFPQARIDGFEPNDKPAERQPHFPANVGQIHTRTLPEGTRYDLITLFHVLEHVEDLDGLFAMVRARLAPGGTLLVQVPYPALNPFDYVIADHVWHFTHRSLVALAARMQMRVTYSGNAIIAKELTLMAQVGEGAPDSIDDETAAEEASLAWLVEYKAFLDTLAAPQVAVYGTGPAGAWTGTVLGDAVVAYLDDDPARIGMTFNGKPVIAAQALRPGVPVVAPFPAYQLGPIMAKHAQLAFALAAHQNA